MGTTTTGVRLVMPIITKPKSTFAMPMVLMMLQLRSKYRVTAAVVFVGDPMGKSPGSIVVYFAPNQSWFMRRAGFVVSRRRNWTPRGLSRGRSSMSTTLIDIEE